VKRNDDPNKRLVFLIALACRAAGLDHLADVLFRCVDGYGGPR
jgi:hypothetical protein